MVVVVQLLHRPCTAYHGLSKSLLDQVDAALVHGLTIRQEAALQGGGHRRQTLSETGSTQSAACPHQCHDHGESLGPTLRRQHLSLTSNKGKRSLSSSFSWFHFWMSGGINIWMYSCETRWSMTGQPLVHDTESESMLPWECELGFFFFCAPAC